MRENQVRLRPTNVLRFPFLQSLTFIICLSFAVFSLVWSTKSRQVDEAATFKFRQDRYGQQAIRRIDREFNFAGLRHNFWERSRQEPSVRQ